MDNAADRKQIRAAQKAADRADRNRGEVIFALSGTEPGRRYLWERIVECRVFESVYNDNPQRMAFSEGQRQVGLQLMNDFMTYAPDNFILAMREANGRRTEHSAKRARDSAPDQLSGVEEPGWEPEGGDLFSGGPNSDSDARAEA